MSWPETPALFEVNAWVWVHDWSRRLGRAVHLGSLPPEAWDEVCLPGIDAVWLMGVWERSPAGIEIGRANPNLDAAHREALPDFMPDDVVGSPYSVRRYEVDATVGGRAGLAAARQELERRRFALVLDFVPNHVAPDHPWTTERPDVFVTGTADDLERHPEAFLAAGAQVVARGRDPYFPPWPDVVQLDAFAPGLRAAAAETLIDITAQCDGVRCDMAMLMLNEVFVRTWGDRVGSPPATEYWTDVLAALRATRPGTVVMAEAYWDLESRLIELGVDACYDKRLYDRLAGHDIEGIRAHLSAAPGYQRRLVRFTENHDEPRAAATFGTTVARAAAVVVATVPGVTLWHEGQAEGHRTHLPVLLGRRPPEPDDTGLRAFHHALFAAGPLIRRGAWTLSPTSGWPDNDSHRHLLAWTWATDDGDGGPASVVVVNYSDARATARVHLPGLSGERHAEQSFLLRDVLSGERFERDFAETARDGLFVDLAPWAFHVLTVGDG